MQLQLEPIPAINPLLLLNLFNSIQLIIIENKREINLPYTLSLEIHHQQSYNRMISRGPL